MTIHDDMVNSNPRLLRGIYWCLACGREVKHEDPYKAFKEWPHLCCGQKMTVDAPDERPAPTTQKGGPGERGNSSGIKQRYI